MQTTFLNRMSAFLEVPFDRLRIVGIVESSRRMLVDTNTKSGATLSIILKSSNGIGKASEGYSAEQEYLELKAYAEKME